MKCWCTMPMPAAIASLVDQPVTSRPLTSIVPASGLINPPSTRISVDFPAPFSPTSAWISPGWTSSDAPRLARRAEVLSMPVIRIAGRPIATSRGGRCHRVLGTLMRPAMISCLSCSTRA